MTLSHITILDVLQHCNADELGFLSINEYMQAAAGPPNIFACGDVATSTVYPRPKAGVFAVRQGPPLTNNIRRFGPHHVTVQGRRSDMTCQFTACCSTWFWCYSSLCVHSLTWPLQHVSRTSELVGASCHKALSTCVIHATNSMTQHRGCSKYTLIKLLLLQCANNVRRCAAYVMTRKRIMPET